jgi:hypothetical protein
MINPDHSSIAISMAIVLASLSGCLDSNALVGDDCAAYPDDDHMREHWSSTSDRTLHDYDGVTFMVQPWDRERHWWDPSDLPPHIEWDDWPATDRPQLLIDSLCNARQRDLEKGEPGSSLGGTPVAEHYAEEAMHRIQAERERQTGLHLGPFYIDETCCIIRFADTYYAVGYQYPMISRGDGHIGPQDLHRFEGHIESDIRILGHQVIHEATEPFGFYVKRSAKLFHLEVTWNKQDVPLDLLLRGPGSNEDEWTYSIPGGGDEHPAPPLTLTVWRNDTTEWNGDWNVTLMANEIAMDIDYQIAITIFNWAPILPEGYTAL